MLEAVSNELQPRAFGRWNFAQPLLTPLSDRVQMFPDDRRRTETKKQIQANKYGRDVIHLSHARQNVRHHIHRQNHVSKRCSQQKFCAERDPRISHQTQNKLQEAGQVR